MTAATAYDLCQDALRRAHPESRAAYRALAAIEEWERHPALRATIRPSVSRPGLFSLCGGPDHRFRGHAPSLWAAQELAIECGYRHVDITACGRFHMID